MESKAVWEKIALYLGLNSADKSEKTLLSDMTRPKSTSTLEESGYRQGIVLKRTMRAVF